MRRRTRNQNRTLTLKLEKPLLGKMEADILQNDIRRLIRKNLKYLVLDLSNVQLMNGPGIKFLLNTRLQFEKMNGCFQVINPSERIKELIKMINIESDSEPKRISAVKSGMKTLIPKTNRSSDSSKLSLSSKSIAFI